MPTRAELRGLPDSTLLIWLRAMPRHSHERTVICEILVERYAALVRSCVRQYRSSPESAEDLMQVGYIGLYLAISPWVVGFSGMRSISVNNLITGIALAVIGAGLASAYGRTHGMAWVAPIVGIWTIITPWVIRGGVATTATIANNVAVGAVAVAVGAAAMSIAALSRR